MCVTKNLKQQAFPAGQQAFPAGLPATSFARAHERNKTLTVQEPQRALGPEKQAARGGTHSVTTHGPRGA